MASSDDVPIRSSWQPEPRPAWVTALNRFGANPGSPLAFVSFDDRSLLDAAVDARQPGHEPERPADPHRRRRTVPAHRSRVAGEGQPADSATERHSAE
jgi:hypothetical protein